MENNRRFLPSKKIVFFILIITSGSFTILLHICYYYCGPVLAIFNSFQRITFVQEHSIAEENIPSAQQKEDSLTTKKIEYFNVPWTDRWKCISNDTCVYSAYWDDRPKGEPCVRIIVVTSFKRRNVKFKCFLRLNGKEFEGKFSLHLMGDHHFKAYVAMFFYCHWNGHLPTEVGLQNLRLTDRIFWFPIASGNREARTVIREEGIAVCVRPLFGIQNSLNLATFLAYYNLLGAKHFTFYDYKAKNHIKRLLKHLADDGYRIELLPWEAPPAVVESWQTGQMAFMHDCLYRNFLRYTYVLVVDIDEFIVPKTKFTLMEVVEQIQISYRKDIHFGAFVFQQAFFCNGSGIQLERETPKIFIRFQRGAVLRPCDRSKFLARAEAIEEGFIHCPSKLREGWAKITVLKSLAVLNHYRSTCDKSISKTYLDKTILKYKDLLLNSEIVKTWKTFS